MVWLGICCGASIRIYQRHAIQKTIAAKKISAPKRGRLGRRGSGGGMPSRPSEAPPLRPNTWRAEPSRNIFFSLIEKILGARAKKKIVKKMFLQGCRRSVSGGGRRGVRQCQKFLLKWVRAWLYKYTITKLFGFLRARSWAAHSAAHWFCGAFAPSCAPSARASPPAKTRFALVRFWNSVSD